MFVPARFLVIDDKKEHADLIVHAFHRLGSPCIGIHYNSSEGLNREHFRGVRALFIDLHLLEGAAGSDHRRHFAHIASILEENISEKGGPYLLVVWTEHPQRQRELSEYLKQNLDPGKPHARPLAVLCLSKADFINLDSNQVTVKDLRDAVRSVVSSEPQLAALLQWETDVLAAAGETLASLISLVPLESRGSKEFSSAADRVLSRLSREAVGKMNVSVDPRAAINGILSPILADRIAAQVPSKETEKLWKAAVTLSADDSLGNPAMKDAAVVNCMLHVSLPDSERMQAKDLGSVCEFGTWTDKKTMAKFGLPISGIMKEFKVKEADWLKCKPMLVRVGAVCDHAQNQPGPISYLLALEVPQSVGKGDKKPASIWSSPVFLMGDPDQDAFILHVSVRLLLSVPVKSSKRWTVKYRLRSNLVSHLTYHSSSHISRPGVTSMPFA